MNEDKDIKITRLPPGIAYGAYDLQNWTSRRLAGKSGLFSKSQFKKEKKKAKQLSKSAGRKVKPFE